MIKKVGLAISQFLITHPKRSLFIGLFIVLALIPGLYKLEFDYGHRGYFKADNELILTLDKFEQTFSGDDRVALIVHSEDGIFDVETASFIQMLTDELSLMKDIIRVDSLTNYNYTRSSAADVFIAPFLLPESGDAKDLTQDFLDKRKKVALNDEVLPGYLISRDAKTAMILARLRPSLKQKTDYSESIAQVRSLVREATLDGAHDIYISGNAMVMQSYKEVSNEDTMLMLPLLLGTIIILLFAVFRTPIGVLLPLSVIALSILSTFGFAGYIGVKYNSIVGAIPIVLITIAIADTMHLLTSYYQVLGLHKNNETACHIAFQKNIFATFLTSFSTSIGFISLVGSELLPIAGVGTLGAIGSLLAWFLTILIVCPILVMQNPSLKQIEDSAKKSRVLLPRAIVAKFLTQLKTHNVKILVGFALLCLGSLHIGMQNRISSDPIHYLTKDVPFRIATDFMDTHIGGASGPEIVISTDEQDGIKNPVFAKKVDALTSWMSGRLGYNKVISYVDIIKKMNRASNGMDQNFYRIPDTKEAIAQLLFLYSISLPQGMNLNDQVALDNKSIRISGFWILHESNTVLHELHLIEKKIKELGLNGHITGKTPIYQRMNGYVVRTYFRSMSTAFVFIALFMVLIFKSIRIGLLSLIPNIPPLIFGLAAMALLDKPLDIGTVITGAICLGIAVDDTIHLLSHFMEHKASGKSNILALEDVMIETGSALMGTTFILVAGFLTFLLASFVPNINLGVSAAIILGSAIAIDLVILPAIIFNTGEKI